MPYVRPPPDRAHYWHREQNFSLDDPPAPGLPASAERIAWLLWVIGWSPNELARRLNIGAETARQMKRGRRNVPNTLALWLERLAELHLQNWQPEGWGQPPERHHNEGGEPSSETTGN